MTEKLYAERCPIELGQHLMRHMMAMTAEGLHSKGAIASELAWRDKRIAELEQQAGHVPDAGKMVEPFGYIQNIVPELMKHDYVTDAECTIVKEKEDGFECPIYLNPPASAVLPKRMAFEEAPDCYAYDNAVAQAYVSGWNACRQAMDDAILLEWLASPAQPGCKQS